VEPEYPIKAATRAVTGDVVLDATIDMSPEVRDPRLARPVPEFDQSVLNAARAWRFAAPSLKMR
jgi:TonB family protein